MEPYYKSLNIAGQDDFILRTRDNAHVPLEAENRDYKKFVAYLSANNLTINDIPSIDQRE